LYGQVVNFLNNAAQGSAIYSASLSHQPVPFPFEGLSSVTVTTINPASSVGITGVSPAM